MAYRTSHLWCIGFAAAAIVAASVGIGLLHRHYLDAEQRILSYCQNDLAGQPIDEARRKAVQAGLSLVYSPDNDRTRRIVSVEPRSPYLPITSVCTLRHDGTTIRMVSYDPWFH